MPESSTTSKGKAKDILTKSHESVTISKGDAKGTLKEKVIPRPIVENSEGPSEPGPSKVDSRESSGDIVFVKGEVKLVELVAGMGVFFTC